ncbi:MAG: hypothetical protein J6U54_08590 [Clostridiales bacterium]|nr:hypothetical protein [Clostridiales bacterium]
MIYIAIILYMLIGFVIQYKALSNENLTKDKNVRFIIGEVIGMITIFLFWPGFIIYGFMKARR